MVALAALTCSCAKENIVNEGGPKPAASKVINTPENADAESILIYVADGVAGTGAIDSIAKEAGALACKPLFESYPGHEEDERKFGLDRWYKLDLEKGTSLEMVATALSSQKKIERVQYNTRMRNVVTRRPHPYVSNIQTKAVQNSNAAFNDPCFRSNGVIIIPAMGIQCGIPWQGLMSMLWTRGNLLPATLRSSWRSWMRAWLTVILTLPRICGLIRRPENMATTSLRTRTGLRGQMRTILVTEPMSRELLRL